MRISDWSSDVCSSDLALHLRAVADAVDLESPGVALGDADHGVPDEGADRTPHGTRPLAVVARLDQDFVAVTLDRHIVGDDDLLLAELALGREQSGRDGDIDTARNRPRVLADTRHQILLEHPAEDLAAYILGAGLVCRHYADRKRGV